MFNFEEALKSGLSQAEEEQQNITEIETVFDELKSSIEKVTGDRVSIKLEKKRRLHKGSAFYKTAIELLEEKSSRHYVGLIAYNVIGEITYTQELCEWKVGEKGYPVTIDYSNKSTACADKESLINVLKELLDRPDAGKKIKFLIDIDIDKMRKS